MNFYNGDFAQNDAPKFAAGCMILSIKTGRFLFNQRPDVGEHANTWSLWGGKAEPGESSKETALREAREETGINLSGDDMQHILHTAMPRSSFYYDTYMIVVEEEFTPIKNPESANYKWVPLDDLPSPLHWGVKELLSDYTAVKIMCKEVRNRSGRECEFEDVYRKKTESDTIDYS